MLGFEHFKFNDLMFICTFLITLSCTKNFQNLFKTVCIYI